MKETRDSTTYLLEWPKPKHRQHQRLARTRRAETHSPLGMQNGTATPKDNLAFSYKTINRLLSCDPALMLLGIYPNEWKTYVHTETCIQTFTHNCQSLKATEMSFHR